jgi:hypothetical protein
MVLIKTAKEYVKGNGGYRPETEMGGIILRGGSGFTQHSRDDDDDDNNDDDMWRKVKT